jgi:choline dehydrogenase-like flavoprotein
MDFDYVIAGGGSAGCTRAARLSEDPSKTVCLIEAGGEGRNLLVRAPAGGANRHQLVLPIGRFVLSLSPSCP